MKTSKKERFSGRSGLLCSVGETIRQDFDKMPIGDYCHTDGAPEGAVYEEANMTSEDGRVLSTREPRRYAEWIPSGAVSLGEYGGRLCRAEGRSFYYDGEQVPDLTLPLSADVKRRFSCFDGYVIVMPDKYYYQPSTGAFGSLEAEITCVADVLMDTAEVYIPFEKRDGTVDFTKLFREGDRVRLKIQYLPQQSTVPQAYDLFITVKGKIYPYSIAFDPEVFPMTQDAVGATVTVSRRMPDLEGTCVCNDRLFGYAGNTVYASMRGNVFNWHPLGLSEDEAYEKNTAHGEAFTACTVYQGKPVFFTETMISTVYGDSPEGYSVVDEPLWGVLSGAADSLVSMGGQLYYLSPHGVTVYDGDEATVLSDSLGGRILSGSAGSDGRSYFLSAEMERDGATSHYNFVYSLKTGQWHREDRSVFYDLICCDRVLYGLWSDPESNKLRLYALGGHTDRSPYTYAVEPSDLYSFVEFADCTTDTSRHTGGGLRLKRLLVRLEADANTVARVYLSCDGKESRLVKKITATEKQDVIIPVFPNRCHRYRITLKVLGRFKLYAIGRMYG